MSRRARWLAAASIVVLIAAAAVWLSLRSSGAPSSEVAREGPAKKALYFCPMHPAMTSDRPADCPICMMRMVLRGPGNAQEGSTQAPAGTPGRVPIRVPAHKLQLIGVKTSVVTRAPLRHAVRALGRVIHDETREKHVTTKTAGYVEKLYANAVGEVFRRGEPLLEIFSPELLASQQEYVLALRTRARVADSSIPSVATSGDELVESARRRLALFDVSEEAIRRLEATGEPQRTVTLYAPVSGHLTHRGVTEGDRVEAGAHLLDLTDLSRVWVVASVYEHELPLVRLGQHASMTLPYVPGKTYAGRVSLVYPTLDPQTRTAQVRLEFRNDDLALKPDMFAEVLLLAELGDRLSVPASAVVETGVRSVVFVDRGEGLFEPREVAIGLRLPGRYEVLSGLAEGDRVVTSGNFLLDSESKLEATLSGASEAEPAPDPRHEGHGP